MRGTTHAWVMLVLKMRNRLCIQYDYMHNAVIFVEDDETIIKI